MDSQYKLLSELLPDQAAFITSPKTSLANYWGGHCPLPPSVYGPGANETVLRLLPSTLVLLLAKSGKERIFILVNFVLCLVKHDKEININFWMF